MVYQEGHETFFSSSISFLPISIARSDYLVVDAILLKIIESRQISPQDNWDLHGIAVLMSCNSITEYSDLHPRANLNYDKKERKTARGDVDVWKGTGSHRFF